MADLIHETEVARIAPALDTESHLMVAAAMNAQVRRVAPCFAHNTATDDAWAEARWTAVRAVERLAETRGWITRETRGPFTLEFGDIPASLLTVAEEALLAKLCPAAAAATGGGPLGSFPAPLDTDRALGRRP